jgi:hypothetical protein
MKVIIYLIVNVIVVIHLVFLAVAQQIHAQAVLMDTIYLLILVINVMMDAKRVLTRLVALFVKH